MATEGLPHHPQILVGEDRVFVAWDELQQGKRRVIVAHRPLAGGAGGTFTRNVVNGEDPGLYPTLTAVGDGALIAWTSGAGAQSVIRMARIHEGARSTQ
jgi:hypothetical protein